MAKVYYVVLIDNNLFKPGVESMVATPILVVSDSECNNSRISVLVAPYPHTCYYSRTRWATT